MPIKKTLISILLIGVFFLITGRFVVFMSFLDSQKPAFRNYVISNQLSKTVSIQLAAKDLFKDTKGITWEDDNKEIIRNGSFFEVVCIKVVKDSALVFILEDEDEKRLFHSFFCMNPLNTPILLEFIKLLSNLSFLHDDNHSLTHMVSHLKLHAAYVFFKAQHFKDQLIKPPEILLVF